MTSDAGRATGLEVDGALLPADLVIDASGRAGRVTRALRAQPTAGGVCGIAYVDRQYQLHPGAGLGPLVNPIAWQASCDGYLVIIFVHELGTFSVLFVRPTDDRDLVPLRHEAAFTAACRAVPGLSDWTDPERSRPITPVLPGGTLMNYYRPQTGPDGRLALPGLLFVGDAVCTTTPNFGRGITTSLLQATQVLRLIEQHGHDRVALGEAFDAWCETHMRPWVEDHARMDECLRRRWAGEDIDLSRPSPLGPHHDGGRGRPGHQRRRHALPDHDRPALVPGPGRAARPRGLRHRVASGAVPRTDPRRARPAHRVDARGRVLSRGVAVRGGCCGAWHGTSPSAAATVVDLTALSRW